MKNMIKIMGTALLGGFIFTSCSWLGETPAEKLVGAYKVIGGEFDGDIWYFTNYNTYGDSLFIYRDNVMIWEEFCFYDMIDANPSKWRQAHIFDDWYPEAIHPNNPYYEDEYLAGEIRQTKDEIEFRSYDFPFEVVAENVDFVPPANPGGEYSGDKTSGHKKFQ